MRRVCVGVLVAASVACGGGEVASALPAAPSSPAAPPAAPDAPEAGVPAAWPSDVPTIGKATFAVEIPGATGEREFSASFDTDESLTAVADRYTSVESAGWTRTTLVADATAVVGLWKSADGKRLLSVAAEPAPRAAQNSVVVVTITTAPLTAP